MPGTTSSVRPLPPHVDLLVAFTNSVDHELGTDDLTTPAELTRWLVDHGLLARSTRSTVEDVALARRLRDGLHVALVAHHDGEEDAAALAEAADALPLQLAVDGGRPSLAPAQDGVRGALARLLVAVTDATADEHLAAAEDLCGRRLPVGLRRHHEEPLPGLVRVGLRQQGQDPQLPGPEEGRGGPLAANAARGSGSTSAAARSRTPTSPAYTPSGRGQCTTTSSNRSASARPRTSRRCSTDDGPNAPDASTLR